MWVRGSIPFHFIDEETEAQREETGQGSAKAQDGSQVQGFLWGLGLVGLPRDHPCPLPPCPPVPLPPCPPALLLPIREAQTLGQAGNVLGGGPPASRPCVSVLLFARRGVNEVMGLLRHSIRLGLTAVLRAPGCSV